MHSRRSYPGTRTVLLARFRSERSGRSDSETSTPMHTSDGAGCDITEAANFIERRTPTELHG